MEFEGLGRVWGVWVSLGSLRSLVKLRGVYFGGK